MKKLKIRKMKSILSIIGGTFIMCVTLVSNAKEQEKMEDVAFKAKVDRSEQRYVIILPDKFKKRKSYDLIIALHGHGSDRWQFAKDKRSECKAFRDCAAKNNMIAVSPDYRAKTSWMGPKAEADMVQIIKNLKKQYKIRHVFLIGASMGGTSVLTFAVLHPDMVDGVTSMNGLANHLEYKNFQDAIANSYGKSKSKVKKEKKKRSAEFYPEKLSMPIAFTTGGKDTAVPPESVHRLVKKLKKTNSKVLLINRSATGHSTSYDDAMKALCFMYESVKSSSKSKKKKSKPLSLTSESPEPSSVEPAKKSTSQAKEPVKVNADIQNPIQVKASAEEGTGGVFFASDKPKIVSAGAYELGLKFSITSAGEITAFYFYQPKGESGAHKLHLWDGAGKLIMTLDAPAVISENWVRVALPEPLKVETGNQYIISYTVNKKYSGTYGVFKAPLIRDGITAIAGFYNPKAGVIPKKSFKHLNYFLDVEYQKNK